MKIHNVINFWILKSQKKKQTLPAMYCIPNMHKNPASAHSLIASKCHAFLHQGA